MPSWMAFDLAIQEGIDRNYLVLNPDIRILLNTRLRLPIGREEADDDIPSKGFQSSRGLHDQLESDGN